MNRQKRRKKNIELRSAALLLPVAILALFPQAGSAQTNSARSQSPSGNNAFPATAPPDLPSRPFNLPEMQSRTLANGLKIIVVERHTVPTVTMRLAVQAGSVLDATDSPGLANAVATALTSGTDKYTSLQLREAAEKLGGTVGVSASEDYATVSASGLSENVGPLADLLADVLLHPTFPENELRIYQSQTLQGLLLQRQNPAFLADEQISKALYGGHPYGVSSTTAVATQALTPDKLRQFYREHYSPAGTVLVVVGDVKASDVFSKLESTLSGWQRMGGNPTDKEMYPTPPTREARRIYLVNRPGSVQSNIVFGNLAIKRGDPDAAALTVANAILGGSSGSRLFNTVRERSGYAYDVSSTTDVLGLAGDFRESAQTRTAVTADALKQMLDLTDAIRTQPVGATELQDAKRYLTGLYVLGLTSNAGLADRLLANEVYHLPADYLATYRDRINAVTAADVQRVAQTYMQPDKAAIVVVGDADALRAGLQGLGNVEEVK